MIGIKIISTKMKHYYAKPSAQLPKHIKSLQDDTKHAVMKLETSMNWSNHKNMRLHAIIAQLHMRMRLAFYLPAGKIT